MMATRSAIKKYKDMRYSLVRTSIDDAAVAKSMAKQAIDAHLAASVHIRPVESLYVWEDEECDLPEYEVEFMVPASCLDDLVAFINKKHPYHCPEIIKTGFQVLNDDFAIWVNEECQPNRR